MQTGFKKSIPSFTFKVYSIEVVTWYFCCLKRSMIMTPKMAICNLILGEQASWGNAIQCHSASISVLQSQTDYDNHISVCLSKVWASTHFGQTSPGRVLHMIRLSSLRLLLKFDRLGVYNRQISFFLLQQLSIQKLRLSNRNGHRKFKFIWLVHGAL